MAPAGDADGALSQPEGVAGASRKLGRAALVPLPVMVLIFVVAGPDASPSQIEALEASAFKSSTEGWSIPIGDDVFCLASDYYGWNFGLDLAPAPAGTSYSC